MKLLLRILLFFLFLAGLIGVRGIEDWAFYDPFLQYFKNEGVAAYPEFEYGKLIFSHILRYLLNVLFSCGIVYALFLNKKWVKQTAVIMLLAFVIIFPLYLWSIGTHMKIGDLLTFYLRRFVIQPVLLLLIIPIFYFQYRKSRNSPKTF